MNNESALASTIFALSLSLWNFPFNTHTCLSCRTNNAGGSYSINPIPVNLTHTIIPARKGWVTLQVRQFDVNLFSRLSFHSRPKTPNLNYNFTTSPLCKGVIIFFKFFYLFLDFLKMNNTNPIHFLFPRKKEI